MAEIEKKEALKPWNSTNNVETGISKSHLDRNSMINIGLLLIAFYGLVSGRYYLCSFWFLVILFDDFCLVYFKKGGIFDSEIGIQRGYQFAHVLMDNTSGQGRDLGFNLYNGDKELIEKGKQADYFESQKNKWDYIINHLGLRPGMSLCDVGCGYGDWLNYAKSKGIKTVGVNITPEQADYAAREYGLEIYCTNWKDILKNKTLQKKLYDRFDVVTFMDTVEHYVHGSDRNNLEKQGEIYASMFEMAKNLINKKSELQKVFISCLHQREEFSIGWPLKIKFHSYLMTRTYSGFYPIGKEGLTRWCTKWFNVVQQDDKTEDYRLTAVLDPEQFQTPKIRFTFAKLLRCLLLFFLDPHHLHKHLNFALDSWMSLYGDDVYSLEYNTEKRAKSSFVVLYWITLALKQQ